MSEARVLVVDDEPDILETVRRVLAPLYEVRCVNHPEEAPAAADAFDPDVAIVDVRMPGLDGFELLRLLQVSRPGLDVILMTGSVRDTDAKLVRAIREKAFYFLEKPFDREVLLTIVERCVELRRLAADNRRLVGRLRRELDAAKEFQMSLLPRENHHHSGVSVAARYRPCVELSGDFFDCLTVGGKTVFLVADVAGHGAAAAMLTGTVKAGFRESIVNGAPPAEVLRRVRDAAAALSPARFVTAFCGRISGPEGLLEFANGGHPPGILRRSDGATEMLSSTGPLLSGALPDARWQTERMRLGPGDRLVVVTDGILESRDGDREFGLDGLLASLEGPGDVSSVADRVVARVGEFTGGAEPEDDWTVLCASLDRGV